jgi:hypothetical protein
MFLSWGFVQNVLLYDPMDSFDLSGTEAREVTGKDNKKGRAWGPEIKSRNLFSAERTNEPLQIGAELSVEPIAKEVTTPPPTMPVITLSGIIYDTDGSYKAFIKVGDNPVTGVHVGDMFRGVSVLKIEERKVELMWNGKDISLKLKSSPLTKKR